MEKKEIHSGSHFKKIVTKGSWYFIASIIIKALAILTWPITTRYLSQNDIGILDTLDSIRSLLPIFISLSLDEAYLRFYFNHNRTFEELKKYISTYFWIIISWGLVVLTATLIIGRIFLTKLFNVPFFPFISLTMLGPLLLQLSLLGGAYLKQLLRAKLYSISQVLIYVILYGTFLYLLVFQKLGAASKIYGFFVSDMLSCIIFGFFLIKNRLIGFKFDKKLLAEGLKFSLPLLPNQMNYWITGHSDRILIGIFKGFSSTGLYSIGYRLGQAITIFSESIFRVYNPIMFSMFINDKENSIKKLERFFSAFFFVIFWLTFCIAFFAKEIVYILTSKSFHDAYIVTPFVVFAYFLGAVYKPFYNIISYHKKTWIISVGSFIQAGLNLGLNILLIPILDRMAAAYTTLISYIVFFIWIFLSSRTISQECLSSCFHLSVTINTP